MQPELITALAALGGAAVGGLTTVWATHRTNRAAAERERAQRLHDQRAATYTRAQEAVTEFLARYHGVNLRYGEKNHKAVIEEGMGLRSAAVKVKLLLPDLREQVDTVMASLGYDVQSRKDVLNPFTEDALTELNKLRPH